MQKGNNFFNRSRKTFAKMALAGIATTTLASLLLSGGQVFAAKGSTPGYLQNVPEKYMGIKKYDESNANDGDYTDDDDNKKYGIPLDIKNGKVTDPKMASKPMSNSDFTMLAPDYAGALSDKSTYSYFGYTVADSSAGTKQIDDQTKDSNTVAGTVNQSAGNSSGNGYDTSGTMYALFLKRARSSDMLNMYTPSIISTIKAWGSDISGVFSMISNTWFIGIGMGNIADGVHKLIMGIFDAINFWPKVVSLVTNPSAIEQADAGKGGIAGVTGMFASTYNSFVGVAKVIILIVFVVGIGYIIMGGNNRAATAKKVFGRLFVFALVTIALPQVMAETMSSYKGFEDNQGSTNEQIVRSHFLDVQSWAQVSATRPTDGAFTSAIAPTGQSYGHLIYPNGTGAAMANGDALNYVKGLKKKDGSKGINLDSDSWIPNGTQIKALNMASDMSATDMIRSYMAQDTNSFNAFGVAQRVTTATVGDGKQKAAWTQYDKIFRGGDTDTKVKITGLTSPASFNMLKQFNLVLSDKDVQVDSSGKVRYASVTLPGGQGKKYGPMLQLTSDLFLRSLFSIMIYSLAVFTIVKMFGRTFIYSLQAAVSGSPKAALMVCAVTALGLADLMISSWCIELEGTIVDALTTLLK